MAASSHDVLCMYQNEHHQVQVLSFMAASSHDVLASHMYQNPDIPIQVTFQDSAILSGLQKINKNMDNSLYAMRVPRN